MAVIPALLFTFLTLTTYRLTRLITLDDFPFGPPRRWLETHHGESWFGRMTVCPHCCSVWISAGIVAVTDRLFYALPLPILWFGAVAGLVSILFSITSRLDD